MSKQQPTQPQAQVYFVRNPHARVFALGYNEWQQVTDPNTGQAKTAVIPQREVFVPGLNVKTDEQLQRCGFDPKELGRQLELVDVPALELYRAEMIIGESGSRAALEAWLAMETRPEIVDRVRQRLTERRVAR